MSLKKKFKAPIVGFFFLRSEITGWEFTSLSVIMYAFTAQPMTRTIRIGTWTGLRV